MLMTIEDPISVTQAAEIIGVSRQRVLQLIQEDRLVAQPVGTFWVISRESAEEYADSERQVGRPPEG